LPFSRDYDEKDTQSSSERQLNLISFGIIDDLSFDVDLATRWNCRGFAADPTVETHASKLQDLVTFHRIGLNMLRDNEERLTDKG